MNGLNLRRGSIKRPARLVVIATSLLLASFVNVGHARQVVVVAPLPVVQVAVPLPYITLFGGEYDGRREARDYGRRGHESRGIAHGHDGRGGGRR